MVTRAGHCGAAQQCATSGRGEPSTTGVSLHATSQARGLRVMEMELGEAEEAGQGSGAQGGGAQVVAALTASPVLTAPRELQPQLPYTEVPVPGFSQVGWSWRVSV